MSAWDVAGAVVWPLVCFLGCAVFIYGDKPPVEPLFWLCVVIGSALGTVFCIARLFGANA